ncbi:MAG: hypothetical protein N2445_01935, partial [Acidobacteria bacterium]|nr:hypothetical protein [Acidobacteriota bacterium]
NLSGTPSDFVLFAHTLLNNRASDYVRFVVSSSSGFPIYLYLGEILLGIDNGGNCLWDYVNPAYDSNSDGFPDLFVEQGNSFNLTLYIPVPSGATIGSTDTIVFYGYGHSNGGETSATDTINVKQPFEFSPSYSFSDLTEKYGASGKSVYLAHKIYNFTSTPKKFTFYANGYLPYNESSWQISIYSDPDGDGNPSDGSAITYTDDIPAMGGEYSIVVEIKIPSSVAPPALSNSLVTAVKCLTSDCSTVDSNIRKSVEDDIKVSYIVPFSDNIFTISETHFTPCETLYSKAFNVAPNQAGRYRVRLIDPSLNVIRDVSKSSDNSGGFTDEYQFPADSQVGNYKLQLIDGAAVLDESNIYIEKSGNIQANALPIGKDIIDDLSINYFLFNSNNFSDLESTKARFLIKDPSNTLYLKEDGSWALIESGCFSKIVDEININAKQSHQGACGFASVIFPSYGQYSLCVNWELKCGSILNSNDDISSFCTSFYVVSMESYADSGRTSLKDLFSTSENIYFSGNGYQPSSNYNLAVYNSTGERILSDLKISEIDGNLLYEIPSSTLPPGNYKIAVFPDGIAAPQIYLPNYDFELSSDQFSVFQIALLRFGGVTSINPLIPPRNEIFINYPQDPSLSFERDLESSGYVSGAQFAHETSDLTATPPLVFYQLYGNNGNTLRVSKEGGKIVITY